jgi:hypothetical protein
MRPRGFRRERTPNSYGKPIKPVQCGGQCTACEDSGGRFEGPGAPIAQTPKTGGPRPVLVASNATMPGKGCHAPKPDDANRRKCARFRRRLFSQIHSGHAYVAACAFEMCSERSLATCAPWVAIIEWAAAGTVAKAAFRMVVPSIPAHLATYGWPRPPRMIRVGTPMPE